MPIFGILHLCERVKSMTTQNEQEMGIMNTEIALTVSNPPLTPGRRLRQVRESRNIGLEEVAKNLRLSVQRVTLIEADDYESMGASAFVRGYLRNYARFLDIPEEDILNSFGESGLDSGIRVNKPHLIYEKMIQPMNPSIMRVLSYLVFIALLVSGGVWWYTQMNSDQTIQQEKAAVSAPDLNQQGVSQVMPSSTQQQANPELEVSKNLQNAGEGAQLNLTSDPGLSVSVTNDVALAEAVANTSGVSAVDSAVTSGALRKNRRNNSSSRGQ